MAISNTLEDRLLTHSVFIDSVISLIPPKNYLKNEDSDAQYQPNKRKRVAKQVLQEQKKQAKRLKLDPNNLKTSSEIQRERLEKLQQEQQILKQEDESDEEDNDFDEHNSDKKVIVKDSPILLVECLEEPSSPLPIKNTAIGNISDRLSQIRKASIAGSLIDGKNNEGERVKREARKKENKKKAYRNKKIKVENDIEGSSDSKNITNKGDAEHVSFGKFEFSGQKKKKKKKNEAKIMEELQSHKEEIGKLKQENPEKAEKLIESETWKNVLLKAHGEKVKDDPKLLKKTIKRVQQKKKSSEKTWKNRIEAVEKSKVDRQKRRTENIQARTEKRKSKKSKKK